VPNLTIQDHNQADWCSTVCNIEALKEEETHAVNCMEVFFRTRQGVIMTRLPCCNVVA